MERVAVPTDPWSDLVGAVERRDLTAMAAALSDDVTLTIPPLHLTLTGRDEVLAGLAGVLDAFPDLAYRTKSRYVSPRAVTDEAIAAGTQSGTFLGSPGTGGRAALPMRLIVEHDDLAVVTVTVYPDVASLRTLGGATARHIDLTATNVDASSPLVSALRASMQQTTGRVIIGTTREAYAAPSASVAAAPAAAATSTNRSRLGPGSPSRGKGPKLKSPVPRRVRRTRAIVGGAAMLTAAIAIISWVGVTALRESRGATPRAQVSAAVASSTPPSTSPTATPTATPTQTPAASTTPTQPAATVDPSPDPTAVVITDNKVTFSSDLLFATADASLTRLAKRQLEDLVAKIKTRRAAGPIKVTGYTDSVGGSTYNLALSLRRARSVASALRSDLAAAGLTNRVSALGRGEADWVADNGTAAGQRMNRRVTIVLPPALP